MQDGSIGEVKTKEIISLSAVHTQDDSGIIDDDGEDAVAEFELVFCCHDVGGGSECKNG